MNHYPLHVGDWTTATVGLSLTERGAYHALLNQYYANEAPLPLDQRERYRLAGASSKSEFAAVDYVVGRFFVESADGWHNKRADEEIAVYKDKQRKASASASQRWEKCERNANAMRTHSEGNANQEPIANNHKPEERNKAKKASPAAPPSWVPDAEWNDWLRHRGRKATPLSIFRQLQTLEELRNQGHNPADVINLAIESGWATFYPPREAAASPRPSQKTARREEVCRQMFGNLVGRPAEVIDIKPEIKRVAL